MVGKQLLSVHEEVASGFTLSVTAHPVVNLALVHNGVPVIQQIAVTNTGDEPLSGIRIEARINGLLGQDAPEWSAILPSIPPGSTLGQELIRQVIPDRERLAELREAYDATLRVSARSCDAEATVTTPLSVLAANEWFAASFCFDSLASFVEPNAPAVTRILSDAADILGRQTGDTSLQGYQSGARRAGLIAAAVYAALAAKDIRYVNPPASFERSGQKIRNPEQVIDERLGTCLDLSVAYAACLEQVGLNPLLWVIDGHAFVGFLREETTLTTPVIVEPNKMLNLAESGRAVVLEASFYGGTKAPTFKAATEIARRHLADPGSLLFVLDVAAARRAGVKPFPRTGGDPRIDDASAPSVAAAAADLSLPDELTRTRDSDHVLDTTDHAPPRVKRWKSALLDLSTRNRLLNLRPSREVIPLLVPSDGLPLLDDLVHNGAKLSLRPADDLSGVQFLAGVRSARDLDPVEVRSLLAERREVFAAVSGERYASTFKHLQRTARMLLEETGSTNLYMTFGSLIHRTASGKEASAPLFVLPIRVVGGSGKSRFEVLVDTAGIAAPNHCLIEWLRVVHNVTIRALSSPPTDDSGIDVKAALSEIRQSLIDNNLDFRIDEAAFVAICKFGTLGLWQDLQLHWDELAKSPLVHHLAHQAGDTFVDPGAASDVPIDQIDVDETAQPLPVAFDGSQLKAIEASAQGRTFVLEGPPGTGKSQTITNLIARNLAAGRTVLFVAEKQAALDVVRRRLEVVGLALFTLNLHGSAQKAGSIRQQLKDALEFRSEYSQRRWDTSLAVWKSKHRNLEAYPEAVHTPNNTGDSLWDAADFVTASPNLPYYRLPLSFVRTCTDNDLTEVRGALTGFARTAAPQDLVVDSPWTLSTSITSQDALPGAAVQLRTALEQVLADACATQIVTALDDPVKIELTGSWLRSQAGEHPITAAELAEMSRPRWIDRRNAAFDQLRTFQRDSEDLARCFHAPFLESGDHSAIVQAIQAASSGLLGKKKRHDEAVLILRQALRPGVDLPLPEARRLVSYVPSLRAERAAVRTTFESLFPHLLPSSWDPLGPAAERELHGILARLSQTFEFSQQHPEAWQALTDAGRPAPSTATTLLEAGSAWTCWAQILGTTVESQSRWQRQRPWFTAWRETQSQWTSDVERGGGSVPHRRATLERRLAPLRSAGLSSLADDLLTGQVPYADAPLRFDAGIARTSIAERLETGRLTEFTHTVQDGNVADFAETSGQMRELVATSLPARLAEHRPFDPTRLTGKYGKLRRALDGKRNAMSVRSLVREYGFEIQAATPCFLVSPASLAQFVPPGSIQFDLVVFDEASQVTVAQSVGALGRARSAVIVGDSKQMPPTMIGVVGSVDSNDDEDDAETVPEDLDSILTEAVESGIERLQLNWHYRSKDESLIAFSNQKYYDAKLASLPSPGRRNDAGVEFRRLNGHFNREDTKIDFRTNRVEAEAVVAEIERQAAADQYSIGVVTFNRQQQEMILNLLEARKNPTIARLLAPDAVDGLFVKNLENVQGDERDVILFSTAFSKPEGKDQLPLNFGPLSRAGGEKRLNVAVTRARRKVVMFSSFDPADIDLSRTSAIGLAHLRGYMEAAIAQTTGAAVDSDRPQTAIEVDITHALRAAGLEVQPNYGMSDFVVDLAVKAPESPEWQVAVMLDGPRWRDRTTVTDRDLMPGLLESLMSWDSVVRIWLPEWLKDRADVVERVRVAVDAAENDRAERDSGAPTVVHEIVTAPPAQTSTEPAPGPLRGTVGSPTRDDAPTEHIPPAELVEAPSDIAVHDLVEAPSEPDLRAASVLATAPPPMEVREAKSRPVAPVREKYVAASDTPLGARGQLDATGSAELQATVKAALEEIIDVEGPIELNSLCIRIVRRFGLNRSSAQRTAFVAGFVPSHLIHKDSLGAFVWPENRSPATWRTFRTPTDESAKRSIDQIAPEEFINALVWAADQDSGDFEQVTRAALREFQITRLTDGIRDRARACIGRAVDTGRITYDGDVYRPA